MHQFCLPCIQHAVLIDSRCPLCRNDIISIEHGGARIPVRHKRLSGDPMAEHQEPLPSSSSDDEERAEGIVDPDYVDDAFEDQHDSPVNVPVETLSLRRRRRPTTRPGPYRPRARAALHTTVAIPNATETGVLSYDSVRQRNWYARQYRDVSYGLGHSQSANIWRTQVRDAKGYPQP